MGPPLPPTDPPEPMADFRRSVLRSLLLTNDEIDAITRALPASERNDPSAIAEHLVRSGKLTRFQATKLLEGRSKGLVFGDFQILSPIGKGSYGTVYLARDTRNGQLVALKIVVVSRVEGRVRTRFRREMVMGRMVEHPFLARAYESGNLHGADFIAMEYIPGQTLSKQVQADGPLSLARAARIFREIALALEHVHARGLIHRDIKPSNIMITPHDHAKVLDLGLGMLKGEVGDPSVVGGVGYIVGTMDYIAPEQTTDPTKIDVRADLYSLGCTLYFALSGNPPYPGGSRRDKIKRQRTVEATPLKLLRPELPSGFLAIVNKLMEKDPEDRYPNATAVVEALKPWSAEPAAPLDRPEDPTYAEAVAAVQSYSGNESYSDLALLDGSEAAESEPEAQESSVWPWVLFGLAIVIAAGMLVPIFYLLSRVAGR